MKKYFGCFTKKNCKKQIKNNLEKIMKRKGDKLYVNWKGYDNSFKSWIDKNDIVIWKWVIFHLMVIKAK